MLNLQQVRIQAWIWGGPGNVPVQVVKGRSEFSIAVLVVHGYHEPDSVGKGKADSSHDLLSSQSPAQHLFPFIEVSSSISPLIFSTVRLCSLNSGSFSVHPWASEAFLLQAFSWLTHILLATKKRFLKNTLLSFHHFQQCTCPFLLFQRHSKVAAQEDVRIRALGSV